MKLSDLLIGLDRWATVRERPAPHSIDPEVMRVVADSRRVRPGDAFCAIAGHDADGHRFVPQALAAGAVAVIAEQPVETGPAPRVLVAPGRTALAYLAHRCLGEPTRSMTVVGVTGTKGKTTITFLMESIFRAAGLPCGVLGTIAYRIGGQRIGQRAGAPNGAPNPVSSGSGTPAHVTTPGADELAEMFAAMRDQGVRHAVMEVSSHALDQGRTDFIGFDAAIFTNLTGDHADYHPTVEHYRNAKLRLFQGLAPAAAAVINRDSDAGETMAAATKARVTWYGLSSAAEVSARIDQLGARGCQFALILPGRPPLPIRLPLIGRHNVSNAVAAAAAAWRLGIEPPAIVAGLEALSAVPGRMEPVCLPDGAAPPFTVLVDYAHTDDALDNALSAARPLAGDRQLIVVFGCGGDRDRTKRPRMAAVAERWADHIVVTSDNPRTEPPESIIDQILAGFSAQGRSKVVRQADRRAAIERAVALARPGDLVLICGKGHEDYQILGNRKIHFDDRKVARETIIKACGAADQ